MRTFFLLAVLVTSTQAFLVTPTSQRHSAVQPLAMSDEPYIGETEQLLLARKEFRDKGLVQRYGETVKKDGLDGLRAMVWKLFDISNVVFPALGAVLTLGLFLNMMGYGYYFDNSGLVIDTLQNIHQEQSFQAEAAKLAAGAERAAMY
jgi:hypothetical protein